MKRVHPHVIGVLSACLPASPAAAEFIMALTTSEVLAIDVADGTIVSRYGLPAEVGSGIKGIARGPGDSYFLGDSDDRRLWSVDAVFKNPDASHALPGVAVEGIALHADSVFVNGQAPMVPPDSLFVLEEFTGEVLARYPVPSGISGVKDLTSDGTDIWAIDSAGHRIWRVDPASGAFETSFPLPGSFVFAVAWNPFAQELWVLESVASTQEIVAHTLDRTSGSTNERLRIQKAQAAFVLAATFAESVTPTRPRSWGEVKRIFRR